MVTTTVLSIPRALKLMGWLAQEQPSVSLTVAGSVARVLLTEHVRNRYVINNHSLWSHDLMICCSEAGFVRSRRRQLP